MRLFDHFRLITFIFVIFVAVEGQVSAQDFVRLSDRSARTAERCFDRASYFGWEQTKCGFAEKLRQEQIRRQAYAAALARAGTTGRRWLTHSQRSWQSTINRKCRVASLYGPAAIGTIAENEVYFCLKLENAERIEWLERQYRRPKRQVTQRSSKGQWNNQRTDLVAGKPANAPFL
jgi:hypothetical protein